MRYALATILALTLAAGASAQQASSKQPARPDYSRENLRKLFVDGQGAPPNSQVEWNFGTVEFRAFGMRFNFAYLPFFAPLQGSLPETTGRQMVDPMALTGAELATTPQTRRDPRVENNDELKKIEERAKVRAKNQ